MEIVNELKERYDGFAKKFNAISNPNLTEFKSLVLELAGIYSTAISMKTMLMETVAFLKVENRLSIENALNRWILKGYAQDERKMMLFMTVSEALAISIRDLDSISNIIEGCKTLFQATNQVLMVFQIEAKLSYVGHD